MADGELTRQRHKRHAGLCGDDDVPPKRDVALLPARLGQWLLDHVVQLDEISAWLLIAAHYLPVVGWTGMDVPDHAALVDDSKE